MAELVAILAIYYKCTALANDGLLSQPERFACNHTYQEAKRRFMKDELHHPNAALTAEQNARAYQRFKAWETENAELVRELQGH